MVTKGKNGYTFVHIDNEMIDILEIVRQKVAHWSYGSLEDISIRQLTRILARKIKESKILDDNKIW